MPEREKPETGSEIRCPQCGAKVPVDEAEAAEKGYLLCPNGHTVALMRALM